MKNKHFQGGNWGKTGLQDCQPLSRRRTVKITYSDGSIMTTEINGTKAEIKEYFAIGREFNIGNVSDNIQTIVKLEFLED